MLTALSRTGYRALLTAQVVSIAGTGLATVALGLLAYDLAGARAGLVLGGVFAVKMVAYVVLGPLGSAIVHRWPPRRVMVASDLVRVGAAACLPWVTAVWQVFVLVFVLQAASAVHTPTFQALLPTVLTDEREYTQALSLSRLAEDLEMVAAPALAAVLLIVLPSSALFVGTAAGFAVSAALIWRSARGGQQPSAPAPSQPGSLAARALSGIRAMGRTPALRPVLAINLAVAAGGALVLVLNVVVIQDLLGRSEQVAAGALIALGAGSTLVAVMLPRAHARMPERAVMLGGAITVTTATAAAALIPVVAHANGALVAVLAIWALVGAGWSAAETPVGRLIVRATEPNRRPAVYAAQFSLSHATWLVMYPLAGLLGTVGGVQTAALVLAGLAAGATLAAVLTWPARTEPARLPELERGGVR